MSNRSTYIIAGFLIIVMLVLAFTSSLGDSLTMDEQSHIPAGYSYLTQKDFRINPEHPPLVKDLSAVPLLLLNLNFPKEHPSWKEGINEQWWFGSELLYRSGNNPDKILFWARLPMLLFLLILGIYIFKWAKELGGNKTALLSLALFSFSPTFIAHGRLVTTDVAAACGFLIATYYFIKFLKKSTNKNLIIAGLSFGIALLLKFSVALLIPSFAVITFLWVLLVKKPPYLKKLLKYIGLLILVGLVGAVLIWLVYEFHVWNYPAEYQVRDSQQILESNSTKPLVNLCVWMADKPLFRPLGHYLLGLLMATQRTAGGNTTYFLGIMSGTAWWYYFPIVYLIKVPLVFHVLTLIALFSALWLIKKPFWIKTSRRLKEWIKNHFPEFSMLIIIAIYWFMSVRGNLNIGVRHVLPTFPFIYILISIGIIKWIENIKKLPLRKMAISLTSVFLGWYIISSCLAWPFYLTYFNEIAGGSKNGYKYAVDSNLDWGQDLKRLAKWVEKNNISKIKLDYFGGGDPNYYLGEKYQPFDNKKGPQRGWLAISGTLLQGGRGNPAPNFNQPAGYYLWLNQYKPIEVIGNSIFVYYIE